MSVKINESFRQKIRAEIERTGLGAMAILKGRKDKPNGFNANKINNILKGTARETTQEIYDYIGTLWQDAPIWIDLTTDIVDHLNAERNRTQKGLTVLFRVSPNVPDGLTVKRVETWLSKSARRCRKDYYDFIVDAYAELPDAVKTSREKTPKYTKGINKTLITEELVSKFRAQWDRTGIGPTALARILSPKWQHIKGNDISRWLTGYVARPPKDDVEQVLDVWTGLPTKRKPSAKKNPIRKKTKKRQGYHLKDYAVISGKDLATLRAEKDRTKCGGIRLMRNAPDPPAFLSGEIIESWLRGASKSAPQASIDYVLKLYRRMPTRK